MKIARICLPVCIVCFIFAVISLKAQPAASTAVQQQQNFQQTMELQKPLLPLRPGTNAPETYQGENADIGPQHVLRLVPQRTFFMVRLDSQYLYTDNVLLTQAPKVPGTEFVNTAQLSFAPAPYRIGPGRISPSVGYMSQWFNYEMGNHNNGAIDFNVQTLYVSAKYQFQGNWTMFGEFDYNRFLNQVNYGNFYWEYVPSAGVQRLIQIKDNMLLSVGVQADYHDSWTAPPQAEHSQDRADGLFTLSFAWQMTRHLVAQPYYRFQYTYYQFNTLRTSYRDDYLNSLGLSMTYNFTPYLGLRVFFNKDINTSDDAFAQSYRDYNVGADLSLSFRF
jgi:hypothetical protein